MAFDEILHGVPGVNAKVVGLAQGAGDSRSAVQVCQAQDLPDVVCAVGVVPGEVDQPDGGHRIKRLKGKALGVRTAALVLLEQCVLVLGVHDVLIAPVAANMRGPQFTLMVNADPLMAAMQGDLLL